MADHTHADHTHAIVDGEHRVLCSFNASCSNLRIEVIGAELVFTELSARTELARVQADRDWSIIPLCGWSVLTGDTVRTENGTICSVRTAGRCMLVSEDSGDPCCQASEDQVQTARRNGGVVTVKDKRYVLDEHYPEEYEPWPSST